MATRAFLQAPSQLPDQASFDLTVGALDRVLSLMVAYGRATKLRAAGEYPVRCDNEHNLEHKIRVAEYVLMDAANQQTLKHHAEDMIAAGQKILRDLGEIEGTPQPFQDCAAECEPCDQESPGPFKEPGVFIGADKAAGKDFTAQGAFDPDRDDLIDILQVLVKLLRRLTLASARAERHA